jgi:hypothetical protein
MNTASKKIEIFVQLPEEGTEVWRPVQAVKFSNGLYKIISTGESDENWEFNTGQIVKCTNKTFADGKSGLVAIEKV